MAFKKLVNAMFDQGKAAPAPKACGTPASNWRERGEKDPHGDIYDCERDALCMGNLTDDELANAAFLNYDRFPSVSDILDGKAFMPIAYMTAVKDRIRWLSRKLVEAQAEPELSAGIDPSTWAYANTPRLVHDLKANCQHLTTGGVGSPSFISVSYGVGGVSYLVSTALRKYLRQHPLAGQLSDLQQERDEALVLLKDHVKLQLQFQAQRDTLQTKLELEETSRKQFEHMLHTQAERHGAEIERLRGILGDIKNYAHKTDDVLRWCDEGLNGPLAQIGE